jgi:hypothetical protein
LIYSASFLVCSKASTELNQCTAHIPREIGDGLVRLYIGPGFAYKSDNAHGGNLKKKEINHGTQEEKG